MRMFLARFSSGVEITEADETDLVGVMRWRNPDDVGALQRDRSHITDFVAKKRGKIIGHIQLCRHTVEGHSLPGYWLSALLVRTLYRGRGVGEELSCAVNRKASVE